LTVSGQLRKDRNPVKLVIMSEEPLFAPLQRLMLDLGVSAGWEADLAREVDVLLHGIRPYEMKLNFDHEPAAFGPVLADMSTCKISR
jgi:hypothetical protein